jgi:hypothetical protein
MEILAAMLSRLEATAEAHAANIARLQDTVAALKAEGAEKDDAIALLGVRLVSDVSGLESRIKALEGTGDDPAPAEANVVGAITAGATSSQTSSRPHGPARELLSSSIVTRIGASSLETGAVAAEEVKTLRLKVAGDLSIGGDLHINGTLFWHGQPVGFDPPSSMPTSLPTSIPTSNPTSATSCSAYQNRGNGWYKVLHNNVLFTVWCSFTSSGAWRVGVPAIPLDDGCLPSSVSSPAAYASHCASHGFPLAGRNVAQSQESWLVQKRMLWDTNHALVAAGFPDACGYRPMPVMQEGSGVKSIYDGVTAVVPANDGGDRCDAGQRFCGYWYNTGWNVDDNSYPDPEDWDIGSCSHCTNRYISCIGLEEA